MKWIQKAKLKKGALSRQLNIPIRRNIPKGKLDRIIRTKTGKSLSLNGKRIRVTPLLKKRVVLARTLKRFRMNKRASMFSLLLGLIMGVIVVMVLIQLVPALVEILDYAQSSQSLNCAGYVDTNLNDGGNYSYNSSIGQKSSMACMGIKLYLPLLILVVLIAVITKIIYDKVEQSSYSPY